MKRSVAVVGAGSWGTALATVLSENHDCVALWARRKELVEEINKTQENKRYLPGIALAKNIQADASLACVVEGKTLVLLVVPSHAMRDTVRSLAPHLHEDAILVHATKGLEIDSLKRMSEVIEEEIPAAFHGRVAVLSGPSHAEEVGMKAPTTVVVAAKEMRVAEEVQDAFITSRFRVYTNPDIMGVEIGGALKNIIALGAGVSDGLAFGDNAKAALLTRGLAEISRLGIKLGANPLTFTGLAGVGDLVVTATSQHSRNWRAGHMLAQGMSPDEIVERMGMVVEGIKTTKAARELSRKLGVEMPITRELHALLFEDKSPREAVNDLMGRVRKHETEALALEYFENH
ncbi:NAD(P)H-dependent glycerol-3-phosphate dehydrogenase [Aneurinibacillus sp. REN35]|uniref:NAD(P)H-dependent glycerol-3-phosphate dehydrogenase n=1 Tax=Aneurinibacillus sp. REN35 TaxID=3237286 RepID=UPI0035275EE2